MADSNVLALSYVADTLRWAKANARAEKTQEVDLALQLDARRRAMQDSNFQKAIMLEGVMNQRREYQSKLSTLKGMVPGLQKANVLPADFDVSKFDDPAALQVGVDWFMAMDKEKREAQYRDRVAGDAATDRKLGLLKFGYDVQKDMGGALADRIHSMVAGGQVDPAKLSEVLDANALAPGQADAAMTYLQLQPYLGRKGFENFNYAPSPVTNYFNPPADPVSKEQIPEYTTGLEAKIADARKAVDDPAVLRQMAEAAIPGDPTKAPEIQQQRDYFMRVGRQRAQAAINFMQPRYASLIGGTPDRVQKLAEGIKAGRVGGAGLWRLGQVKLDNVVYTADEVKQAKALAGGQAPAAGGTQVSAGPLSREQAIQNVLDNPFNLTPDKVTAWAQRAGMSYNDLLFAADGARKTKSGNAE